MMAKKFEKQLLRIDSDRVNSAIFYANKALEPYNAIIPKVSAALKERLNDEEIIKITEERGNYLVNIYRPKFPFPNASIDFNMNALGLDLTPVISAMQLLNPLYFDIKVENGKLCIADSAYTQFTEDATTYTSNERQNEVLRIVNEVSASFEKLNEYGLVSKISIGGIGRVCSVLDYREGKITFNPGHITDIAAT